MFKRADDDTNPFVLFVRQTFRRHTGREYSELLTRGIDGNKGDINKNYPWAYLRLFALLISLYAVFLLIVRFTNNELFVPVANMLAAVCFNLPFLLFLYELYPERDLSFIGVCLAMLLGGAGAHVLAQVLYSLFSAPNAWLSAVYAGFFEELCKTASMIICIIVAKKHSPLSGFLFGAAVGCGFSVGEDMGYIFLQSNELPAINLTVMIQTGMMRGMSALCTHTLWTAMTGWAYCFFDRRLSNAVFYSVLLLSCGLHICWDLPLAPVPLGLVYAGCVTVGGCVGIVMLVTERNKVFARAEREQQGLFVEDSESLDKTMPEYWKHAGHLALVIGCFLMSLIAIIYCAVPFRETYGTQTFGDAAEFVYFMQDGRSFDYDADRQYSPAGVTDETVVEENGRPVLITQHVDGGDGVIYNYAYSATYDEVYDSYYYFRASDISVTIDGITYLREEIYDHGKLYASFFRVNSSVEVTGYNLDSDGGITIFIYDADFVRDWSEPRYVILFSLFAAIVAASAISYVALRIKAWRVKKCLTKIASSAK